MVNGQQKDLAKWVSAAVAIVLFLTSTGFALGVGCRNEGSDDAARPKQH